MEDGTESSEDNGRSRGTEGFGGLTKVGGSHINICVCFIVVKSAMITSSIIAYHDCLDYWRHEFLHLNGAHDESPHQVSLKAGRERRSESRVEESCCERRFERCGEESFDRAGFSFTCEITTVSDAGYGGVRTAY